MSDNARQFIFFSSDKEDDYEEDIDNYDNELFNIYDDGIGLSKEISSDEVDDDDDDLIEDGDTTLPLFSEEDLDEFDAFDEMDD